MIASPNDRRRPTPVDQLALGITTLLFGNQEVQRPGASLLHEGIDHPPDAADLVPRPDRSLVGVFLAAVENPGWWEANAGNACAEGRRKRRRSDFARAKGWG